MENVSSLELLTFTDEPLVQIEVKVWQPSRLHRLLKRPLSRTFTIYRTRVCNMGRAAAIAFKIKDLVGDVKTFDELIALSFPIVHQHKNDFIYLIACCIQNNSKEPSKSLIKFLDDNLNGDSLNAVLAKCLWHIGLQSFLSATILIKGTSVNFASETDVEPVTIQE